LGEAISECPDLVWHDGKCGIQPTVCGVHRVCVAAMAV